MMRTLPAPPLNGLTVILPLGAIALARLLTFSTWATDNTGLAAILFAWIVADSLLLALIAKASTHRPELFQVFGVITLAGFVILAGAAPPIRDVYLTLPHVLYAVGGMLMLFIAWSTFRVASVWRDTNSAIGGLESVFPPHLVRRVVSECKVLALGVFRWGVPADIPANARGFTYHTYLTPMITAFAALQLIELSVVHLLLMLWNPTVAWVVFALSVWGLIWTVALLKSVRINPVLLTANTVRVRSGMIYDFEVPRDLIAGTQKNFSSEELAEKGVLNLAIMSSPNVSLRFKRPIRIETFFGRERTVTGVALRLDESAAFCADLVVVDSHQVA